MLDLISGQVGNGHAELVDETPDIGRDTLAKVSLVVPCYNEQAVLPETIERLTALLDRLTDSGRIDPDSSITFVDDGSKDTTWQMINAAHARDERVKGIKLSRNRGHQNALLAGLLSVRGDVLISLDADLQDDLDAIPKMLDAWRAGAEIVYGVRTRRDVDTPFKRITARLYYRMLLAFGVEAIPDHADFRLMSRRAIQALREFGEVNLFLRGIIPLLGFNTATVHYDRKARTAGETHYPFKRMLALALDGIMAFSSLPLQIIFPIGAMFSLIAAALACWAIGVRLLTDTSVPGGASIVIPMYFLGGLQLLALGVMGGYLARIYAETKKRPRYIIEEKL
jgi:glycosyltransferase involved in cell wall biosynthesis